jgi:hypothetical protein
MVFSAKLLGRSQKIAYNLLHKVGAKGDPGVKAGDRVSLLIHYLSDRYQDIHLIFIHELYQDLLWCVTRADP